MLEGATANPLLIYLSCRPSYNGNMKPRTTSLHRRRHRKQRSETAPKAAEESPSSSSLACQEGPPESPATSAAWMPGTTEKREDEMTTCADSPRSFLLLWITTCADSPRLFCFFLVWQLQNRPSCSPCHPPCSASSYLLLS